MATTLQNVLNNVAAYVNQDSTLPTGTDLTSWTYLVNQAQNEWANTYQWKQLRTTVNLSFSVSGASIGLPGNYSKLMTPVLESTTKPATPYFEIEPRERYYKLSTDKYCTVGGDDYNGHYLLINPVPASGASLVVDIQVTPSSLATLTDVVSCPSPQFLILRTISKILSARSDPRFPQVKADSDDIMASLIEEEVAPSRGELNQVPDQFTRSGFRIGES